MQKDDDSASVTTTVTDVSYSSESSAPSLSRSVSSWTADERRSTPGGGRDQRLGLADLKAMTRESSGLVAKVESCLRVEYPTPHDEYTICVDFWARLHDAATAQP